MPKEVARNDKGEPFSKWKPVDKFVYMWIESGFDFPYETEYKFDFNRQWRLDFAWPSIKLGVEIDGFGYGHQAQQNIASSHEKQNAAVEQGWKVLRYTSTQLGSYQKVRDSVEQVQRVICGVQS
mgnify:CR=1 FL=1